MFVKLENALDWKCEHYDTRRWSGTMHIRSRYQFLLSSPYERQVAAMITNEQINRKWNSDGNATFGFSVQVLTSSKR